MRREDIRIGMIVRLVDLQSDYNGAFCEIARIGMDSDDDDTCYMLMVKPDTWERMLETDLDPAKDYYAGRCFWVHFDYFELVQNCDGVEHRQPTLLQHQSYPR